MSSAGSPPSLARLSLVCPELPVSRRSAPGPDRPATAVARAGRRPPARAYGGGAAPAPRPPAATSAPPARPIHRATTSTRRRSDRSTASCTKAAPTSASPARSHVLPTTEATTSLGASPPAPATIPATSHTQRPAGPAERLQPALLQAEAARTRSPACQSVAIRRTSESTSRSTTGSAFAAPTAGKVPWLPRSACSTGSVNDSGLAGECNRGRDRFRLSGRPRHNATCARDLGQHSLRVDELGICVGQRRPALPPTSLSTVISI